MKLYVEGKRSGKAPNTDRENGVALANEVSDLCGESFNAANEARLKSKKGKFDDTGLVAAVCRHDRVWFLVNMKEAGEKQYYMFTILDKLFQEIPRNFTVGFLHDLACQYHRSMMKARHCLLLFRVVYLHGSIIVEDSTSMGEPHSLRSTGIARIWSSICVPNHISST
jgi:hypothetical protein